MKKNKLGFLAVIAMTAMSFTVLDQADILNKFTLDDTDCFLPSFASQGKISCTGRSINLALTTCNTAIANYSLLHLFAIDQSTFLESQNISSNCPGGSIFCCFTITQDNNPLLTCLPTSPNQPLISINGGIAKRYKVNTIFCKE
jgi:hypothetical protein